MPLYSKPIIHQLISLCQYYWQAKTLYNIHSPFLFELFNALNNKTDKQIFKDIDLVRKQMFLDKSILHNIQDHGAGSQKLSKVKTVSQIAKVSSSSKIKGELLYKLSHYFNPDSVLEFGTNLGIGTSYIHLGNPKAQITTVEGDPTLAEIANKNFNTLSNSNITVINDHFDNYLESASPTIRNFPFIFIDGNHTYEATVSYFEKLSNPTLENQVLIFDDIYWNKEMTRAWKDIQKKVTNGFCIDLYSIGIIVHSNKADNVTNCSFINKKWKPLSFGFWG